MFLNTLLAQATQGGNPIAGVIFLGIVGCLVFSFCKPKKPKYRVEHETRVRRVR